MEAKNVCECVKIGATGLIKSSVFVVVRSLASPVYIIHNTCRKYRSTCCGIVGALSLGAMNIWWCENKNIILFGNKLPCELLDSVTEVIHLKMAELFRFSFSMVQ